MTRGLAPVRAWLRAGITIGVLGGLAALAATEAAASEALLRQKCTACHEPAADATLPRIDQGRRTPEAWDMTLVRMTQIHGVALTGEERRVLVKHLADTRGLAPQETEGWRYVLERRPGVVETPPEGDIATTCSRCHSYARIALQRRTEADWLKLSHFHLGQFPTAELQSGGRDRNWWEIASGPVVRQLGRLYPLDAGAWQRWQATPKADLAGRWRLAGHRPGRGSYEGHAVIVRKAPDSYELKLEMRYEDGALERGEGSATVFSGYEWRASLDQAGAAVRQVLALSEDGSKLAGRWFFTDADVLGGDLLAVRADGAPRILSVQPAFVKAGTRRTVAVHGVGLEGEPSFGKGVRVERVVSRTPETVVVEVRAAGNAATGARAVAVGRAQAEAALAVYRRIDHVRVVPENGLARLGGDGGTRPKLPAQFEAVAYANGPDGKPNTGDDVRIGVMPARWSADNLNAAARAMKDLSFTGTLDASGLFTPAAPGPNKARKFGTNNAGELKIVAAVKDGKRTVKGHAPLIVTVQRWVDPPIH